jgi:hypothetical protein
VKSIVVELGRWVCFQKRSAKKRFEISYRKNVSPSLQGSLVLLDAETLCSTLF